MFDIGWSELLLIGVVALVVIGPKDLPKAIYAAGKWVRKARMAAREFQGHIDDMMREAELDELRQHAMKARDLNLSRAMESSIDPAGEIKAALQLPPVGTTDPSSAAATTPSAQPPEPALVPPPTAEETAADIAAAAAEAPPAAPADTPKPDDLPPATPPANDGKTA